MDLFKRLNKHMYLCCVYRIYHEPTGLSYIGATTDLRNRISKHLEHLRDRDHVNHWLQALHDHWGKSSFRIEVLQECPMDAEEIWLAETRCWCAFADSRINPQPPRLISIRRGVGTKVSSRYVSTGPRTMNPFWSYVIKGQDEDACWGWSGRVKQGRAYQGHHNAAIVSLVYHTGEQPDGRHALHMCDNKICCNPRHLYFGTDKDNTKDRIDRFRSKLGRLHGLNAPMITEIRERYLAGETCRNLEKEYGFRLDAIIGNRCYKDPDYAVLYSRVGNVVSHGKDISVTQTQMDVAREIRRRYASGESPSQIGRELYVPDYQVSKIIHDHSCLEIAS